ncbi:type III-B CRISPR-associated protein Cas10/Cmr2 [Candidatus Bathyarchaeota archaeon]|nr:type III-B CRISPR-associated protein Cas10/Cmr2 [Candidatus Bathyarchaeota archaeon]
MDELDVLRVSALLHDIGKLECWAERKPWMEHVRYTYRFVKECLGEDVAAHAMRHHSSPYYPSEWQPKNLIERIVCLADNFASGADRREEPSRGAPLPSPPVELTHVLSRDHVRSKLDAARLAYMYQRALEKLKPFMEEFWRDPRRTYFKIFDLLDECSELRLVPADTRPPINDVSLWDHMKLTAAFATCIYLSGWRGNRPESYRFALLSGDADRVSRFIGEALRLPDLRARSFLIKKATDAAEKFLRRLLGPECILFAAGGSILALCPPNRVEEALDGVKRSFEEASDGEVTITTSYVEAGGEEIRREFGAVWKKAREKLRFEKSRRMNIRRADLPEGLEACDVCGIRAWSHEDAERILPLDASPRPERLCDKCWNLREMREAKGVWLNDIKRNSNFVGCIKADGDNIGVLMSGRLFREIDKFSTPSRISALSDILHKTCERKFGQIISKFGGKIVYAGGDDLLAFVPGESALEAAKEIYLKFRREMAGKCTMSAGIAIFHYKLPVYVGVEAAGKLLSKAKGDGKNRVAFAIVGGSGITVSELDRVRSMKWSNLDNLLEVADFMRKGGVASSQIRRIAEVAANDPVRAEALIQYSMGREIIGWREGEKLLSYLNSGLLLDAFTIYNLFKGR